MKRLLNLVTIVGVMLLTNGCESPYSYVPVQQSSTKYFTANIVPVGAYAYDGFDLTINNTTTSDIEIDWNRTLYIENGSTSGTFMFDGIVYKDRNNPKAADVIFANSTFNKTIYPNNLVNFTGNNWTHEFISTGRFGVLLSVRVDGREIQRKIYVDIQKKSN